MLNISKTEQAIFKCLIMNNNLIMRLDDNYFLSGIGISLYETLLYLFKNGLKFNNDHIIIEGNKRNSALDLKALDLIQNIDADITKFDFYLKELRKNYAKEKVNNEFLKKSLVELGRKNESQTEEELISLLNYIENEAGRYKDLLLGKTSGLITPSQMYDKYTNVLHKRNAGLYKFTSGCTFLDKYLKVGFSPGKMTFIFGASGTGKSIFCLHLINNLINMKIPTIYFSPENDLIMTCDRMVTRRNQIRTHELNPHEDQSIDGNIFSVIEKDKKLLEKSSNFFFVEEPSIDLNYIRNRIKEAKRKTKSDYLVLFVDLFTMAKEFSGGTAQEYEDACNRYHVLCREENIHLVGILQASKNVDNKVLQNLSEKEFNKFRPTIGDIKNSNAFRERGRIIISVFRKKYYADTFQKDSPYYDMIEDFLEVQILKQNEGMIGGKVFYLFVPEMFSLYPFEESIARQGIEEKENKIREGLKNQEQ